MRSDRIIQKREANATVVRVVVLQLSKLGVVPLLAERALEVACHDDPDGRVAITKDSAPIGAVAEAVARGGRRAAGIRREAAACRCNACWRNAFRRPLGCGTRRAVR